MVNGDPTKTCQVDRLFRWTREPDPRWQEDLDRLNGHARLSRLQIIWMPGEPDDPVHRWVIYEIQPNLDLIPDMLLKDCRGPNPRTRGHFGLTKDENGNTETVWITDSHISLLQWQLFRETNCYPTMVWVIQGHYGGHKRWLTAQERWRLRLNGGEKDVPLPGEEPYAEYDSRVFDQLAQADRLKQWALSLSFEDRYRSKLIAGRFYRKERQVEEQAFRQDLDDWLKLQVKRALDETKLPSPSELPKGDRYYDSDREKVERKFIEDTSTNPTPRKL